MMQTYCSIAFEITTSNKRANHTWIEPTSIGAGYPYHVWVCGEPQRRMGKTCAFFF